MVVVAVVGGQHVEMQQQPFGFVLDRLWKAGFTPRLPERDERPVIDVDGGGLAGLAIDPDQADDGAVIDDPADADM